MKKIYIKINLLIIFLISCCSIQTNSISAGNALPFLNGIDENDYINRYSADSSLIFRDQNNNMIQPDDLPYKYFASKGVNAARIRVWVGDESSGNLQNAIDNAKAAKLAGMHTLLVVFLSEKFSDNICCEKPIPSIFDKPTFNEKLRAIKKYVSGLMLTFKANSLSFDMYAVGNEVMYCLAGEKNINDDMSINIRKFKRMSRILKESYSVIRKEMGSNSKFLLHAPDAPYENYILSIDDPDDTVEGEKLFDMTTLPLDASTFFYYMIDVFNVPVDYISTSFYPLQFGSESFSKFKNRVEMLYANHGKPFIISEWSYAMAPFPADSPWLHVYEPPGPFFNVPANGYSFNLNNQELFVNDLLDWAKAAPEVAGAFYWGPMLNNIVWKNMALFNPDGSVRPAVNSLIKGSIP
ncbi:arabinogalactan endo-1,4-beta-galactosidase [Candidatus Scalindua japonica]|uniref:Arabinogalactan endo-beta-1,4-galactanase n=1 Tax=Candidatus Scalindua japonica TaxID=1284222 RepID=A0A286U0I6_9BACT|nr:glycosyl hydrolase 53 family protein [Candidatus Scalindua japonica]GAX61660.1 arabinogalactan endo-1,4-beta-galactosidase [Candidatus Scalindua japonica]